MGSYDSDFQSGKWFINHPWNQQDIETDLIKFEYWQRNQITFSNKYEYVMTVLIEWNME